MTLHNVLTSFLLLLSLAVYSGGQSEPKSVPEHRGFTINDLFRTRTVAEVAISPDRKHIAYTLNVPRPFTHEPGFDYQELYLYNIATHRVQPFITGSKNVTSIGWTPDSRRVVFMANFPDVSGTQIYAIDISGGEAYPLTRHPQPIIQYGFAGNNLVVFTAAGQEVHQRKAYREKGFDVEIFEEELSHLNLYITEPGSGNSHQLTQGVTVFDFAVSPDGQRIAAAIAPRNLVDHSFMFRRIHLVDIATRSTTILVDNPGKLGRMSWSPDSRHLAFLSSSQVNDAVAGSLYVVNVQLPRPFDQLRNYLLNMRASAIDVTWRDARTLIFATEEGVDIVLSTQRLTDRQRKVMIPPARTVFTRVSHSGGLIAFAGNTPEHPSELFIFDSRKRNLRKLTDHNPWLENVKLGRQDKVVYSARDGMDIEGVVIYPSNYQPGKTYPMIVYVHGGPEAAVQNGWNTYYYSWGQIAASRGYIVFMPNYRSGSGRGVDFTMAGFGDLLGKEYDDVIDGIDHLIKTGIADPKRIGIGGASYGGYFAAWSATKHTERFAAAVVFAGISNQVSKRNTTDIPVEDYLVHWGFWTHENPQRVYDVSPVKYAHLSKTPTLILHGTGDTRIPATQALELYRTIKLHSEAPVRLVYYPGEGHGNKKNTNRLDFIMRTMDWFDHYLKGDTRTDMPPLYPTLPAN